ncbi:MULTISPECIES: DUF1266 domain-containing protein [Streptomyces]|uniref:DUF1266 domain-containing protein n=1 Tax=Streptomyces TaxID=1883 RepID=UPI00210DFB86|nr:DUF1266 domain-containing protein [Streptomyces longispororuber]MCQ4210962.1 DUF1266 domain-containing protein [Streptomyces longispororuber]
MAPFIRRRRATRAYPTPLTLHQLWMVSLAAPVSRDRDAARTTLYPFTRLDGDKARRWLAEQWEIGTREELLGRLGGLARSGYRAGARARLGVEPLAWDIALYVDITRRGFACGMLTEADAWNLLKNVVPQVAGTYNSWQEYADHYLLGRQIWREDLRRRADGSLPAPQPVADAHLRALLDPADRKSPWNAAPWDSIRQPDRARA